MLSKKVFQRLKAIGLFAWSWFEWTALVLFLVTLSIILAAAIQGVEISDLHRWTRVHTAMIPVLGLICTLLWGEEEVS